MCIFVRKRSELLVELFWEEINIESTLSIDHLVENFIDTTIDDLPYHHDLGVIGMCLEETSEIILPPSFFILSPVGRQVRTHRS